MMQTRLFWKHCEEIGFFLVESNAESLSEGNRARFRATSCDLKYCGTHVLTKSSFYSKYEYHHIYRGRFAVQLRCVCVFLCQ